MVDPAKHVGIFIKVSVIPVVVSGDPSFRFGITLHGLSKAVIAVPLFSRHFSNQSSGDLSRLGKMNPLKKRLERGGLKSQMVLRFPLQTKTDYAS